MFDFLKGQTNSNSSDAEQVRKTLEAMSQGKPLGGKKLRYNPHTKKLEVVSSSTKDPDDLTPISPEDAAVFHTTSNHR